MAPLAMKSTTNQRGRKFTLRKSNHSKASKTTIKTTTTSTPNARLCRVLEEIANQAHHQERLRVGKFTKWACGQSAAALYRIIQLVEQMGRHVPPRAVTTTHALTASQVLQMAETTDAFDHRSWKIKEEPLPWASSFTAQDVMGVLWLIGMIRFNQNATSVSWNPRDPLQTPDLEGVTKLVQLVHGMPVLYQRGGRDIAIPCSSGNVRPKYAQN